MKVKYTDDTPRKIKDFNEEELNLNPDQVEDIAEIFKTPLTGTYNWDYTIQDNRIAKLYELGKKLNWNTSIDIDWDRPLVISDEIPPMFWDEYPPYKGLDEEGKREFLRHRGASQFSQFLHGEQGALLVASQLVSCAPTYQAKLYAASQAFDEARHVEAFTKYIQTRSKLMYPVGSGLKSLLDKILTDQRWDLKLIGMQIIIEGLALAAFNNMKIILNDGLLKQLLHYVIRDEARHVTFGVNYLEDYLKTLSKSEIEDRAQFAFEACVVMRNRLISGEVISRFLDYTPDEAQEIAANKAQGQNFRVLLFTKIVPNLKRIGLLTDKVKPQYEKLGVLSYAELEDNFNIDWADMSKPYETQEEIEKAISLN